MTAPIADRAAGVLQGGADAVQGVAHKTRFGDRDHELSGREAAANAAGRRACPQGTSSNGTTSPNSR